MVQVLLGSAAVSQKQNIKIRARGVCPICKKPFTETKIGFICIDHLTTPNRHVLDFWREVAMPGQKKPVRKERTAIYSTKAGKVLETFSDACDLKSIIEEELRNKTFDPDAYKKQNQSLFFCSILLQKFLGKKLEKVAPGYKREYKRHVKVFQEYFGDSDVREIASRKIYVSDFIDHLEKTYVKAGTWKHKTLKNCVDKMETFLNWVHDELELIPSVPSFPDIETEASVHTWVRSPDQLKLFAAVRDEDKPIVGFLMLHGIRPGEARALKCKDIDIEGMTIIVHATFSEETRMPRRKGKKAKPLYAPIHPEALEYLKARKAEALDEAWVFPNPRTGDHYTQSAMQRLWGNVRRELKVSGIRLYDASRHSYASQLVAQGVSIHKVKELLGHSSVKTTDDIYAHADLESLRMEIGKVSLKVVPLKRVSRKSVSDPYLADEKGSNDE